MVITRTYFSDNNAESGGGHGGAIYISSAWSSGTYVNENMQCRKKWSCMVEPFIMMVTASITVTNSTFVKNRANEGRGGALYSARHYTHYCP